MTSFAKLTAAGLLISISAGPLAADAGSDFLRIAPDAVQFKSPLGAGPQQAILFGDPTKPGVYVVRNKFPPGAHSNPHFHSQDRHATVIKGTWWTGVGPELDFRKAIPLQAGAYMFHPAGGVHWDGAGDEEVIVQIVGVGPVDTQPAGDPKGPGYWPKPQ